MPGDCEPRGRSGIVICHDDPALVRVDEGDVVQALCDAVGGRAPVVVANELIGSDSSVPAGDKPADLAELVVVEARRYLVAALVDRDDAGAPAAAAVGFCTGPPDGSSATFHIATALAQLRSEPMRISENL